MIKTLIFDFGNVFINLDIKGALSRTCQILGIDIFSEEIIAINSLYEQGLITTREFLEFYKVHIPDQSKETLIEVWNCLLKDFPKHRLEFIKTLKSTSKYKLILLSNTNELHINWIIENVPFYNVFKACFDAFYLSHEIKLRKPNRDIFEFVLTENKLNPSECLFIDDNQANIETADQMEFQTWHINPKTEDVVDLFKTKSNLFNS
ncbi:HAD family hydrolase [Aestuariivivens marinum]|uniref:HAD family hydrolase n=1 Tax=Aestuariivivens marinum TaxID=2913555 RepID=UPI001F5A4991|nr:HAD family phosphatase [Aestuariivivens marinum]